MDKKHTLKKKTEQRDADRDVRFCLNCNETGNFDGDICARLFVADDGIEDPTLFADEDEDS